MDPRAPGADVIGVGAKRGPWEVIRELGRAQGLVSGMSGSMMQMSVRLLDLCDVLHHRSRSSEWGGDAR